MFDKFIKTFLDPDLWVAKNIGKYNINLLTGDWNFYGLGVCSSPLLCDSLDQFSNISFEVIDPTDGLITFADFDLSIGIKDKLRNYVKDDLYCRFILVPVSLFNECVVELECGGNKIGGKCQRCGVFDKYAPLDSNGKCYCYKCFYK